jgi:hypothetical protein
MVRQPAQKKNLYSNCKIFAPDGELLCCCSEKKIKWYLDRGLAEQLPDEPRSIRLLFEPDGRGHAGDPFYLGSKENQCVVCGSTEMLTKHHSVPYCYRKHFPEEYKCSSSHDVLLTCATCHDRYERLADDLKRDISIKYGVPRHDPQPDEIVQKLRILSLARSLVDHSDKIPLHRQQEIKKYIGTVLGCEVTDETIKDLSEERNRWNYRGQKSEWGKKVVDQITDIEDFCKQWRHHFVNTMQPKFLHPHWNPDRPLRRK